MTRSKPLPTSKLNLQQVWSHLSSWWQGVVLSLPLTVFFLWPLVRRAATHLPSYEDGLFISWTIQFVTRALMQGQSIFQAPLFAPYSNTLAFSQPFLSTAVLSVPFLLFTQNMVLLHNIQLVLGTILMFTFFYVLGKKWTGSALAALAAGLIFVFSPLHLEFIGHLHVFLLAGIPWSMYWFVRWLETPRWRWLALSSLGFLYQALNDPHTAFFLMSIFIVWMVTETKVSDALWKQKKQVMLMGGLALIICGLFYWPYLKVSTEFQYTRAIRDTAHFALSLERWWQPDIIFLLSLGMAFWSRKKGQGSEKKNEWLRTRTVLLITLAGALLMLGPVLKLNNHTARLGPWPIPLPYALAYYGVPGFQAMRTPSRWLVVLNVGLALLIARALSQSRLKTEWQVGAMLAVTVLFWLSFQKKLTLFEVSQHVPPIYSHVATSPGDIVAEFPLYNWDMRPFHVKESERLLFQTHHQKRLYNGYSGFTPPERITASVLFWQEFPSLEIIRRLRSEGVELMVVDYGEYTELRDANYEYARTPAPDPDVIKTKLTTYSNVVLLTCEEDQCLYQLH